MIRSTVLVCVTLASASSLFAGEGLVVNKPSEGRFVEVPDGYLVPYETVIPGTNVRFGMEPVPGGTILIDGSSYELAPFWIGRTEVTWSEYRVYMGLCGLFEAFDDAGIRQVTEANRVDAVTAPSKLYDPGFTFDAGEDPGQPAVSMSQYAAKQYTKWLSLLAGEFYRLPSEAEWSHAALSGDKAAAGTEETSWHEDNSDWATKRVALKNPNAWGLYDMFGNACEWTLDSYDEPVADIDGPGGEPPIRMPRKLFPRVLKGGSSYLPLASATASARRPSDDETWREYDPNVPKSPWWFAYDDAQDIGFRIVRPFVAPTPERRDAYWEPDIERIQKVADFRIDEEGRGERGIVGPELAEYIRRSFTASSKQASE